MIRHAPTRYVDHSVLENIVGENYEKQLSDEENALIIERVPTDARPWFEGAVISEFYVPLKGIMNQPIETLALLIFEVFQERENAQDNGDRIKKGRLTLKGSFEYAGEHMKYSGSKNPRGNVTFEGVIENTLSIYRRNTMTTIRAFLQSSDHFKYVSPDQVRTGLVSLMK